MTSIDVRAEGRDAGIGPGRLILVVGPSGAGKDTLIAFARAACAGDESIVFPRRVVTRAASSYEDNGSITEAEFLAALARGAFALHWQAHGLRYGLPRTIFEDVSAGRTVVSNVSRTVVGAARSTFAEVTAVLVTAPPDVLASRLVARARSSDGSIDARLRRTVENAGSDMTIVNIGSVAEHGAELLRAIRGSFAQA